MTYSIPSGCSFFPFHHLLHPFAMYLDLFCQLLLGGADHCVDERSFLLAGAVQISKMAADGVGVCGGCARHQFALSFVGRGLMHDDADL